MEDREVLVVYKDTIQQKYKSYLVFLNLIKYMKLLLRKRKKRMKRLALGGILILNGCVKAY